MCAKLTAKRRDLSLNALRAFEAMARTGGATAAAAELGVTHGAVSRQVKALEHSLGAPLFAGPRHRLELTPTGRDLLRPLTLAFDQIAVAVAAARSPGGPLRLAVHPSLSVKWLIPRLPRLAEAEPALVVEITELPTRARRQRHAHGALRLLDRAEQAAVPCHRFMPNQVGPVLSPGLLARLDGDVLAAPRLASATHPQGWRDWAVAAGAPLPDAPPRAFAHLHFAFDAAIAGLGAMVAPWPLVADDLAAGRLVAPLGFVPDDSDFVLIPAPGEESRQLRAFLRWLRAEAAAMPPPCGA
ncbi:MAG TPA: LysR substrate-binding domain-containing protein [Caulobacter sp.]|nr:LysR substrate-binding domain-containing protein [Caulobacter sp.]